MSDDSTNSANCGESDCFVPTDRRQFLRDSFLTVAGALVALGMAKKSALAMPLEFTSATRTAGSTRSYPIPTADGAQIDKENDVILVRWQNALYAFALSCPHQNTALKWDDRAHEFACPKHHSRFTAEGTYIADSGRATRNMDRFAVSRDATSIVVDLDKLYEEGTDEPQWAGAIVKLK